MKIIAHRGNVHGPKPLEENREPYLIEALNLGFDVELDLWSCASELFLGHNEPQYKITDQFLFTFHRRVWVHAKNLEALAFVLENRKFINGFYHDKDKYTLTTKGFIWTYPHNFVYRECILVCLDEGLATFPKKMFESYGKPFGVCTDHASLFRSSVESLNF